MKPAYGIKGVRATADVMPFKTGYIITRIRVAEGRRGEGLGSHLLNMVLEDADSEGVTLWLEVAPDGSDGALGSRQLLKWYKRHGFVRDMKLSPSSWGDTVLRREPGS